jgi:hypothetical protein
LEYECKIPDGTGEQNIPPQSERGGIDVADTRCKGIHKSGIAEVTGRGNGESRRVYGYGVPGGEEEKRKNMADSDCKQDNPEWGDSKCGWNPVGWQEQAALKKNWKADTDSTLGRGEAISEPFKSVHPRGYPISHSTHVGFNCPEIPDSVSTRWAVSVPRPRCDSVNEFLASLAVGVGIAS